MQNDPSLFSTPTCPYIIVAPAYNPASAGIRALHMLCHALNLIGHRAFIHIYPEVPWHDRRQALCPDLCTSLITQEAIEYFERKGLPPIAVYGEGVSGNPLRASLVVRWLLNYPGLLGGDKTFAPDEILFAYSRRLARSVNIGDDRVLFLPTSDPGIFFPPPEGAPRRGSCFYAAKYQLHHGGQLLPVTANSVEITRDLPASQTKQQIAELFRACELFYTYEDTALAIEAGMCGCPTVFIPNDYLTDPLGFEDMGRDGYAWGTSEEEIARAKATVGRVPQNYRALTDRYWRQLRHFVGYTQAAAEQRKKAGANSATRILLPSGLGRHAFIIAFIWRYIRRNGWQSFVNKAKIGIRRQGIGNMMTASLRNICQH